MKAMQDLTQLVKTYEQKMYLDGEWTGARSGKTFVVRNPATGEALAAVPDGDASDTQKAIHAAYSAFAEWSGFTTTVHPAARAGITGLVIPADG